MANGYPIAFAAGVPISKPPEKMFFHTLLLGVPPAAAHSDHR